MCIWCGCGREKTGKRKNGDENVIVRVVAKQDNMMCGGWVNRRSTKHGEPGQKNIQQKEKERKTATGMCGCP